jgi:predicted nucleic acid-binding protein
VIFVDTWAWLALAHKHDPYHPAAVRQHRTLQGAKERYVTTDYVLAEVMTPLFGNLSFAKAEQFMLNLFQSIRYGTYQLELISPSRFERAWQMRRKYKDKSDISFVDFTSMVVMQDLRITDIFTGDADFQQVGLGFHLLP